MDVLLAADSLPRSDRTEAVAHVGIRDAAFDHLNEPEYRVGLSVDRHDGRVPGVLGNRLGSELAHPG